MTINEILAGAILTVAYLATLFDLTGPRVRVNRVGGLTFVRVGRFGGSFYRARGGAL